MTNYNERIDEILFNLTDQSAWDLTGTTQEQHNELTAQLIVDRHEAKQAITSLIKELVAEAKPNKKPQFFCQGCDKSEERGYNNAIKEFEQNLLKALEAGK